MSEMKPEYGKVDPANLQAGPDHPVSAVVGQAFAVQIPNAKDDPGASWINGFDSQYLTLLRAGYQPNFDGTSFTWAEFLPKVAGTTVIEGVQQPHLINPLFLHYNFTVTISP